MLSAYIYQITILMGKSLLENRKKKPLRLEKESCLSDDSNVHFTCGLRGEKILPSQFCDRQKIKLLFPVNVNLTIIRRKYFVQYII